jgi:hypothetical protein
MPLARASCNCIMRRRKTIIAVWVRSSGLDPFNFMSEALVLFCDQLLDRELDRGRLRKRQHERTSSR